MKTKKLLLLWYVLLLVFFTNAIFAGQPDWFDQLEVIHVGNMDRVDRIASLGPGVPSLGSWSDDGQTFYLRSSIGVYEFDVNQPSNYRVSEADSQIKGPVPPLEFSTIEEPIAINADGTLAANIILTLANESYVFLSVMDISTGEEHASILIDSPLVFQRYSADTILPQFSEDGALLYVRDGSLYQWLPIINVEALLIEQIAVDYSFNFTDLRINPQGTYAAVYMLTPTRSSESAVTIYDLAVHPAEAIYTHVFPPSDVWHSIAVSPDGQFVATGGSNHNVRVWQLSDTGLTFRDHGRPNEFGQQQVVDLTYSADGRYLIGCAQIFSAGPAFVRDARTGEELATVYGVSGTGFNFFRSVAVHPTKNIVAFGGANGTVQIWEISALIALGEAHYEDAPLVIQAHDSVMPVVDVHFSVTDPLIVSTSWDGTISTWNYETNEQVNTYTLQGRAWSALLDPDGSVLALAGEDGSVSVREMNSKEVRWTDQLNAEHEYHRPYIVSLRFNPDGTLLAGAGFDGSVYLWNVATGERSVVLERNGSTIWQLEFNQAGTMLVTADVNARVNVWGVTLES